MSNKETLFLIFSLVSIIENKSIEDLKKFVSYCSRYVDTKDFENILRICRKVLNGKICEGECCIGWLQSSLLKLYDKGFT